MKIPAYVHVHVLQHCIIGCTHYLMSASTLNDSTFAEDKPVPASIWTLEVVHVSLTSGRHFQNKWANLCMFIWLHDAVKHLPKLHFLHCPLRFIPPDLFLRLFPASNSWLRVSREIAINELPVHSLFDGIFIWTSGPNQEAEIKQRKLRCVKSFYNIEKLLALNSQRCAQSREAKQNCKHSRTLFSMHKIYSKMVSDPEVPRNEATFSSWGM